MDPRRTTSMPATAAAGGTSDPDSKITRRRTSVTMVRDLETLTAYVPAWEDLAAAAIEPNVFYEHWMLLPALEAFAAGRDVGVALVLIHDVQNPQAPPKLGGLFPLERIRNFRNLKVSALSLWQHVHCYVCTPLLRADTAGEC